MVARWLVPVTAFAAAALTASYWMVVRLPLVLSFVIGGGGGALLWLAGMVVGSLWGAESTARENSSALFVFVQLGWAFVFVTFAPGWAFLRRRRWGDEAGAGMIFAIGGLLALTGLLAAWGAM